MKYIKGFSLMALVMIVLVPASASATMYYSGSTPLWTFAPVTTTIESGQSMKFEDTGGNALNTCAASEFNFDLVQGDATHTVNSANSSLSLGSCTYTTRVIEAGSLEVHNISGTYNGTVKAYEEFRFAIVLPSGWGTCTYSLPAGKDLGKVTGGPSKTHAIVDVSAVLFLLSGPVWFCPEDIFWLANYTVTNPHNLNVRVS